MSVATLASTVVGFLEKHVIDLNNVADALSSIVTAVPIDPQDKENVTNVITALKTSVDNINSFLEDNQVNDTEVTVKESDIVTALGNFFASDAGKTALANAVLPSATPSAEGNANNG
jgi:hypothetical protein